jgi:hypothetical protein
MVIKNSEKQISLTVVSGTEAPPDDNGQLRDIRACDRANHFGAVLGDPTFLSFGTNHIPRDIYEKEQRDLALRAQLDEMRRLECRGREQDAVIRDDTHGEAVNMRETLGAPAGGQRT